MEWILQVKENETTEKEYNKVKKFLKENNIKFDERRIFTFKNRIRKDYI